MSPVLPNEVPSPGAEHHHIRAHPANAPLFRSRRSLVQFVASANPSPERDPNGRGAGVSDCVVGQAFCHGLLSRMMALRMVRSFRAVAMRATILGFPAATRRSRKALRVGL